jgi:hypothetical protein
MPSTVAATQKPRRPWRRSAWASAASRSATCRRWATARRSRGGSRRRAAATRTGSALAATGVGRSWVPAASTAAWAADSSLAHSAWAVPDRGPRNSARAVRRWLVAAPAPSRSRPRSQLAVEATWTPCSAPAAPRPSTAARRWSHWPSRQSTSRRRARTSSARAASGKPSRFSVARSSTAAASAASLLGGLPGGRSRPSGEHLFDSMGAPIKPTTEHKHHPENVDNYFGRLGPGQSQPGRGRLGPENQSHRTR